MRECLRGVMVKALDYESVVSEFELQLHYFPSYRLNSITAVLLEGWLWHLRTYKSWYAIKQWNQTKLPMWNFAHKRLRNKYYQRIFIIKGFRTIVFIFIVISTTFRPICRPAFFKCLSNSGTFTEQRTMSFIESTGVACSDPVNHNRV